MEGVLLPREQFQFLTALPNLRLIMPVLQALFRTRCLALPPSPQPTVSCAIRHLVATAVLTIIHASIPETLREWAPEWA